MGNPYKGEVEFTVEKKVYTLHFSINAMCELETSLGGSILELASIMGDPAKLSIRSARTLFWAGLRDYHEGITQEEAGRLMTLIGLPQSLELVAKAFTQAFPEVDGSRPLPEPQPASIGKAH